MNKCICGKGFKRYQDLKGHLNGAIYKDKKHEKFAKSINYYSPLNPHPGLKRPNPLHT